MDKERARHYLRRVDGDVQFVFPDGKTAGSLEELFLVVASLDDKGFYHHVMQDKNDFSAWLHEVVGDAVLAEDLSRASKEQAVALLKARLRFLREHA
ncbi:hypothetical protein GF367_01115 [Candidatus Woesearchaeota archaeon]|nr:hypothetical protein [Candidatus Woesearchaeota archaeon]